LLNQISELQGQLREQEDRADVSELIIRNVADLLAIVDAQGRRVWNNRAYRETLGYSPEELEHTDSFAEVHPEDRELVRRTFQESVESGVGRTIRYRMRHKEGHWVPLDSKAQVVKYDDGSLRAIVLVARDITEQMRGEEEGVKLEKMEALAHFSEKIADDFEKHLAQIVAKISMVRSKMPPEREESYILAEAMSSAEQSQRMIRDMASLGHRKVVQSERFDLRALVERAIGVAVPAGRGIKLQQMLTNKEIRIEGSERVISEAIIHVLRNAAESMPKGGVLQVTLTADYRKEHSTIIKAGSYAVLRIRDQGTGIAHHIKARIFEPYFTTKQGHQGLGLSTALTGINEHKGSIFVESKGRTGTEVMIYLPLPSKDDPPTERISAPIGESTKIRRRRVLIMDDEPVIRELGVTMFEELGFIAKAVKDGESLMEEFRTAQANRQSYNLVVTDLIVPHGEGGLGVAMKIRSISPFTKVIAVSGYPDHPVINNPKEYGFHGSLAKPYRRETVRKVLEEIFGARR